MQLKWLYVPLVIVIFECIIYYKMFFFTGYVQWGNFIVPLKENLFSRFNIVTWDPYDYLGMPLEFAWLNILSNINYILLFLFGGFSSMNIAVKVYVFVSTFAAAYSFYILTGRFVKLPIPRIFATLFFLLTPPILQQIGQGDFGTFIIITIYFASITLLSLSVSSEGHKKYYFLFLSIFLLSFTIMDIQLFYLGVPLYFLFMLYFTLLEKNDYAFKNILSLLKSFIISITLLVLLSMPFILISLFGSYNLSPNSSIANPLNVFMVYSSNFFNMLLMNSFQNVLPSSVLLGSFTSPMVSAIWRWSTILLVIIIIESGIAMRDKRILFWTVIIVIAALLGSDYLSPVSALNMYLYQHMLGYQVLDVSAFWEWYIIAPLYGIIIGILLEKILLYMKQTKNSLTGGHPERTRKKLLRTMGRATGLTVVSIFIVLVIVFPLMGQGFYGSSNSGIHQDEVPSSYDELTVILDNLVGKSNVGVAFFTPDNYVYFGNNTNGVSQPLITDPTIRYPGIPSFGSPPVPSSNYFYWLYNEFYINATSNIAQLFGIMGIKYFVTLDGVISASSLYIANSENPTKLMQYQKDVKLLYSSANFSIFESTLDVNVANGVDGLSILSSNYNILMDAATLGINLSKIVPVFTGDINSSNFNFFLNNTRSMIFFNSQSLTTIAIDKFTNSSDTIDPLAYTYNYYFSPYQGWMSSTALEMSNNNNILSDPYPFAITASNKSMSMSFKVGNTGNFTLYAQVLLSAANSEMQFTIDGSPTIIGNGHEYSSYGSFEWVKIPFHADSTENQLTIKSLNGLNGVQRIVIARSGLVESEITHIENFIKSRNIIVLSLDNKGFFQPENVKNTLVPNHGNASQADKSITYAKDVILNFVPISLVNNQSSDTVKNFQQQIKIDWSEYSTYLNSNVSNVRFYGSTDFSNFNELYAWIETNNTTTSKSSVIWVNLSSNIIPAQGVLTIYMVFLPKSASWGSHWGLAPQLSDPYGKFDNGANVFTAYWNFSGNSLATGTQTSGGGWSTYVQNTVYGSENSYAKQNNGLTLNFPSGNDNYDFFWASNFAINSTFDWYGTPYTPSNHSAAGNSNNGGWGFGLGNEGRPLGQDPQIGAGSYDMGTSHYYLDDNSSLEANWSVDQPAKGVYSISYYSSGSQATYNYTNPVKSTAPPALSSYNVGWGFGFGSSGGKYIIQWARVRISPPDNVMPLASVGNISAISEINNISDNLGPERIVNNPNGYTVYGMSSSISIVRYGYFSSVVETVNGFQVYPILGGLCFLLVSNGNLHQNANFVTKDYRLLLYGVAIYTATMGLMTVYFVITFRKDRGTVGRR